ncbi:phage portal protein [Aliiruegeria lutimaris]|uniref:Phage portal protein, HK97 family n=1 Tax=Aliiruegeria lutimaris TaxID=571298 RepID=A0A1G9GBX6_9RHOB|nr:phage portal protein [Aliiruegeria lutimaris]SDK98122.1 phage portal protein, HK97 family [Aliiruegeria lutimaris]
MWPFSKRAITQGDGKVFLRDDSSWATASIGDGVTVEKAIGLPAVWAAVNFIAGTIAGLPLHIYERTGEGRKRVDSPLATMLNERANPGATSFDWRKYSFERVLTSGRAFTLIDRNAAGRVSGLYPLDPDMVEVVRERGRVYYRHWQNGVKVTYQAAEILDIPFMLKPDGIGHWGPVSANRNAIGLAIASEQYVGRFFQGGGVPPFIVTGNFQSGAALGRAADDLTNAVHKAAREGRPALTLPNGLEISSVGTDMEKAQLVEVQRFQVEQVARIYSLPPTFLQDLTHGTFSNTEQQDLHFAKHTLKRWVEQFEQQLNLKLFRPGGRQFAEFSMDGLLRGDVKTRMEAHAHAIQNGVYSPAYAAKLENAPYHAEGDRLMIQGATVPIATVGDAE